MSEELKPCPFCGGPGTLLRTSIDGNTHIVGCTDCSCCIGIQSAEEAPAAWNKRAPDPGITRERIAAAEAMREVCVRLIAGGMYNAHGRAQPTLEAAIRALDAKTVLEAARGGRIVFDGGE